jgi:hypothetical protein
VAPNDEQQTERDPRAEGLTEAKLPAGLPDEGRDESLTSQEPLDAAGAGKNNRVTPPRTEIPDEKQSDEPGL